MLLIIDTQKRNADALARAVSYTGILSKGISPSELSSEISALYRAVLINNPMQLADSADFFKRIKKLLRGVPIFAICNDTYIQEHCIELDGVFGTDATVSDITRGIIEKSRAMGVYTVGDYRIGGLDASCTKSEAEYFYRKIPLTATENMILRILIRSYPAPLSTDDIRRNVFPASRRPEQSAVRTHICSVNRKFFTAFGKKLITPTPNGYSLSSLINESKEQLLTI